MDENEQEHKPKISDLEVVLIGLILCMADAVSMVIIFFAIDDFWIIDLLVGVPLGVFYYAKGFYGTQKAAGQSLKKAVEKGARKYLPRIIGQFAGELIPYIGALPLYSVIFGWIAWTDRHPEVGAVVEKIGALQGGGAGAAGAVEEAEGAVAKEAGAEAARGREAAAGGAAGTLPAGEEGSGSVRDRAAKQGGGEGFAQGEEGKDEKAKQEEEAEKEMTPEEQQRENQIRGRDIEELERTMFGSSDIEEDIESPDLGAEEADFDPTEMGPKMETKAPLKWAPRDNKAAKGIIDDEKVDLKNKEFLQDAA